MAVSHPAKIEKYFTVQSTFSHAENIIDINFVSRQKSIQHIHLHTKPKSWKIASHQRIFAQFSPEKLQNLPNFLQEEIIFFLLLISCQIFEIALAQCVQNWPQEKKFAFLGPLSSVLWASKIDFLLRLGLLFCRLCSKGEEKRSWRIKLRYSLRAQEGLWM